MHALYFVLYSSVPCFVFAADGLRGHGMGLWKCILFNVAILVMYWLLIHLMGMVQLLEEFSELGTVMTVVMLVMGNVIFFLLDIALNKYGKMGRR